MTNATATTERYSQVRIGERTYISINTNQPLTPGCAVAVLQKGKRTRFGLWWPAKGHRRPYRSYFGEGHGELAEFVDYMRPNDDQLKKPVAVPADCTVLRAVGTTVTYAVSPETPRWSGPGPGVRPMDRISKREWRRRWATLKSAPA